MQHLDISLPKKSDQLHCLFGVRRKAGNCQTISSQHVHSAIPVPRYAGDTIAGSTRRRFMKRDHTIVRRPATNEGRVSCGPDVPRIPLRMSSHVVRRNRPNPTCSTLPRSDSLRVIYADRLIIFDDSPPTVPHLPFQAIAGQVFGGGPLPYIAPEILPPSGSFTRLNPASHRLEFVPRLGWLTISVPLQQVDAIKQ